MFTEPTAVRFHRPGHEDWVDCLVRTAWPILMIRWPTPSSERRWRSITCSAQATLKPSTVTPLSWNCRPGASNLNEKSRTPYSTKANGSPIPIALTLSAKDGSCWNSRRILGLAPRTRRKSSITSRPADSASASCWISVFPPFSSVVSW